MDFTSEVGFETANESSAGKVADVVGKSVGGAGEGDVKSLGATAIAGESGDEESFEDRDDEDNSDESNAWEDNSVAIGGQGLESDEDM